MRGPFDLRTLVVGEGHGAHPIAMPGASSAPVLPHLDHGPADGVADHAAAGTRGRRSSSSSRCGGGIGSSPAPQAGPHSSWQGQTVGGGQGEQRVFGPGPKGAPSVYASTSSTAAAAAGASVCQKEGSSRLGRGSANRGGRGWGFGRGSSSSQVQGLSQEVGGGGGSLHSTLSLSDGESRQSTGTEGRANAGGLPCSTSIDVWAVGVLTYLLLVGRHPFKRGSMQEVRGAQQERGKGRYVGIKELSWGV